MLIYIITRNKLKILSYRYRYIHLVVNELLQHLFLNLFCEKNYKPNYFLRQKQKRTIKKAQLMKQIQTKQ